MTARGVFTPVQDRHADPGSSVSARSIQNLGEQARKGDQIVPHPRVPVSAGAYRYHGIVRARMQHAFANVSA